MKLRSFAAVAALALTALAARAQVGLYLNPVAIRVGNSSADAGPYAFLGQNSTSQVFYGYDFGGYYDFLHAGRSMPGSMCARVTCTPTTPCCGASWWGRASPPNPSGAPSSPTPKSRSASAPPSPGQHRPHQQLRLRPLRRRRLHPPEARPLPCAGGRLRLPDHGQQRRRGRRRTLNIPAANQLSFSSGLVFRF